MTGKNPPAGWPLAKSVDEATYFSDDYDNLTVGDLRELLSDLPDDAPVFIAGEDGETVHPLETFSASRNGIVL